MTAASTSDSRKRRMPEVDPVEVVARELFRQQLDRRVAIPTYSTPQAERVVAALRAEGLL